MDKKQSGNSLDVEEKEKIVKNLSYAVKFSFGNIESQQIINCILQQRERSA